MITRARAICVILYCLACGTICGTGAGQSNPVPLINQGARVDSPNSASQADPKAQAKILNQYGKLPLSFEANQGQTDGQVKFLSRTGDYSLFLTKDEVVLTLHGKTNISTAKTAGIAHTLQSSSTKVGEVLRMKLRNANPATKIVGEDELMGKANYFIGSDPAKWLSGVPTYAKVKYEGIYSGIDLVYYGMRGRLEYDFVVAPGADPRAICLNFTGARSIKLDKKTGDLLVKMGGEYIRFHKPIIYQTQVERDKVIIDGHYKFIGGHNVVFDIPYYDKTKPLVIDPNLTVVYSTILGGNATGATGIAVDTLGNAYVTGDTEFISFPTTPGAFQTSITSGGWNGFVSKLNPTGTALIYSTYLGANNLVNPFSIAVDSSGNAYVTGTTFATNFPTTAGAFQTALGGGESDGFVTKLNPDGSALVYSTYLGGSDRDEGISIALDSVGDAYVAGWTFSTNFPVSSGAFQVICGGGCAGGTSDAFVTELNPTGSALVYSTYLGGSNDDQAAGIAVNSNGNAYVTGQTSSTDFPTTPGAFQTSLRENPGAFVTELNSTGSALIYSTVLGGTVEDAGTAIAVDTSGNAYVTGVTNSDDFPTTNGAFQTVCNGGRGCAFNGDAFLSEFNPTGSALVYSTYLGGGGYDVGLSIAINSPGVAFLAGYTESNDFPVTPGAFQTSCNYDGSSCSSGYGSAFVLEFNTSNSTLVYSTYLGGDSDDGALSVALDSSGGFYVTGNTDSSNFPTTFGALQTVSGVECAFVTKLGAAAVTLTPLFLDFGNQTVGVSSTPQVSNLANAGNSTLSITSIGVTGTNSGDFFESNSCGTTVPVGGNCNITITFSPTALGTRTGAVTIESTNDNLLGVNLYGNGATGATTTSLTSAPNPSGLGQAVTLSAAVAPVNNGTPTGTVTFYDGATSLGTVGLSLGAAQLVSSALQGGENVLTASYSGNDIFLPSTSPPVFQAVNQGVVTVTLGSNPNPSYVQQVVMFTATVVGVNGVVPTGSVTFKSGALVLSSVQLVNGIASFNTSYNTIGSQTIIALYSGDVNYPSKKSNALTEVVNKYTSNVSATSSLNPSAYGQTVNLTSQVTSAAPNEPTGTVTFKNGSSSLGTVSLVNGSALLTKTNLPAGTLSITATYSGDALNSTSTSPTLSQVVNQATTTTTVTSSPNPSVGGQKVSFTATVKSPTTTPVGTVTFTTGTTTLGTVTLSGGKATLTTSTLPAGTTTVTATYNGTSNITGSSGAVMHSVKYTSNVSATSSLNPSAYGQTVNLTSQVTSAAPNEPTGTVTFKNGSSSLGTVSLVNGSALLTKTNLPAGTLSITATYSGDALNSTSTSPTLSQVVNQATTTTTVTSTPNPSTVGENVKFTAKVRSQTVVQPVGTVTFTTGTTTLSTVSLAGGDSSLTTSALPAGTSTVTATYNGTSNISGSSAAVVQTVN